VSTIVRILFWRCRAYSRRDRALCWLFVRARRGGHFRRAVMRLGVERQRERDRR
jgi:hypothetical protein